MSHLAVSILGIELGDSKVYTRYPVFMDPSQDTCTTWQGSIIMNSSYPANILSVSESTSMYMSSWVTFITGVWIA